MNNKLNYPTWLVPLDIAQELKAIGFDESCTFAIDYTQLIEPFLVQDCNKGYNVVFCGEMKNLTYKTLDKNLLDKIAIIPTWEQVFAWFRSKGYHSTLHTYSVMMNNVEEFRFYYEINSYQEYVAAPEEYYKTYEQAQEALVYKLIEIYKSEQNKNLHIRKNQRY
jgi:hypothetical protein|nr:MAG TPA: hypothetical protein [Caudoviricetes sp.]